MKKIVVLGGGNCASLTLAALKPFYREFDIAGIVSMVDSGGSSGRLREEFGSLPAGDILRNILALSEYDFNTMRDIFYKTRFSDAEKLSEHNLGNVFLTFAGEYTGDFMMGVKALGQALKIVGTVIPSTLTPAHLTAELDSGEIIRGETNIDVPKYDRGRIIQKLWLEPAVLATAEAVSAIREADCIILGGGDVYTSMVAALLPTGIQETIRESSASLVYISNRYYHQNGEIVSSAVSEIISELEKYTMRPIDNVVIDPTIVSDYEIKTAHDKKWGIKNFDSKNIRARIVAAPFDAETVGIDPAQLGAVLYSLLKKL